MIIQCDKCYRFDSYLTISNDYVLCLKCLKKYKDLQGYRKYLDEGVEKKRLRAEKKKRRNLMKIQMTLPWWVQTYDNRGYNRPTVISKKGRVLSSLKRKHGNKCFYCNSPDPKSIDHVIPSSKGGSNEQWNLRPCCTKCNRIKSNLSVEQFKSIMKWN